MSPMPLDSKWAVPALALIVTAVASYLAVTVSALLVMGVIGAGAFVVFARRFPRAAITLWLAVVAFLPFWTRLGVGAVPSVVVGLPVLLGVLASRKVTAARFTVADGLLVSAAGLITIYVWAGVLPAFLMSSFVLVSAVAYTLGRMALQPTRNDFARVMVLVALWGIAEFAFDWHAFENWFLSAGHHWNNIQTRGELDRSEAGFGHAIAFAACLALALPFARKLPRPGLAQLILGIGVVTSLSRGPMLAMVLTLGLGAVALTTGKKRIQAILASIIGMFAVYLIFGMLYSGADADDVEMSGNIRMMQLDVAFSLLNPMGPAEGVAVDDGSLTPAGLQVIDSTPLRWAVNFGWVVATLLLMPVVMSLVQFLRGRAGAASIAIVGQIPVLLVTSLITQWMAVFFFVVGMAVTEMSRRKDEPFPPAAQTLEAYRLSSHQARVSPLHTASRR